MIFTIIKKMFNCNIQSNKNGYIKWKYTFHNSKSEKNQNDTWYMLPIITSYNTQIIFMFHYWMGKKIKLKPELSYFITANKPIRIYFKNHSLVVKTIYDNRNCDNSFLIPGRAY